MRFPGDLIVEGTITAANLQAVGGGGKSATLTAISATVEDLAADNVGAIGGALYRALLTQASSAAPTAVVLFTSLPDVLVWARTSAGLYTATLAVAFLASKVGVLLSGDGGTPGAILSAKRTSDDVITLKTWDTTAGTPALADGLMAGATIEIVVIP